MNLVKSAKAGAMMSILLVATFASSIDAFVPSSQTTTTIISRNLVGAFMDKSIRQNHVITSSSSSSSSLYASTMDNNVKKKAKKNDLNNNNEMTSSSSSSWGDRIANSGMASAAAMATAAVNAAVSMKTLQAPDVDKSYIAFDSNSSGKTQNELDEEGLPLVYDKDLIQAYWSKERGALNQRWAYFVGKAVPFLTKLTTLFIRDGKIVDEEIPALSKQARMDLQDLGPTFIKVSKEEDREGRTLFNGTICSFDCSLGADQFMARMP
jgi:hypothetical protein